MAAIIDEISIRGFKSIRSLENFPLNHVNVLIGSNGAGKSNFVSFFRMLREVIEKRFQTYLGTEGGADAFLYLGPRETTEVSAHLLFGQNGYDFALVPTVDNRFVFSREATWYRGPLVNAPTQQSFGSGHPEARLGDRRNDSGVMASKGISHYVYESISDWVVYHFHDTSQVAGVRRPGPINDNEALRPNAQNLAAYLFRIQSTDPEAYAKVRDAVRLAAPFFNDFKLRPIPVTPDLIQLEWLQRDADYPMRASQLSDGTLRFICMATALLQARKPSTVLFDEPELGLHPYALTLLAGLIKRAVLAPWGGPLSQVIVSTQSTLLLSEFAPEDVVVVERENSQSVFRRLDTERLSIWLENYTLGELWQKNVLGGRPQIESAGVQSDSRETRL